jgi:hypothetical protein
MLQPMRVLARGRDQTRAFSYEPLTSVVERSFGRDVCCWHAGVPFACASSAAGPDRPPEHAVGWGWLGLPPTPDDARLGPASGRME